MKKFLLLVFIAQFKFIHAQLWQNDFSNSSEWMSTDLNAGTNQWIISNAAIGGDVDSINSYSAGNGFAQFNSLDQCSGNHQDVVLTYFQTIDISSNELSYLEFVQHYKRKKDTLYVEFSNDGLTWESIRVNQKYWFYQHTSNTDTVRVSIPSNIQSQPFYLRLKYSGECGFAWLIDDLKIFEKEQYAIAGNLSVKVNEVDYNLINHCLIDTLEQNLTLNNLGYDTLFNVEIFTQLFENGTVIGTFLDTIDQILPNEFYEFKKPDFYPLASCFGYADYQINLKIYSDVLDTTFLEDTIHYTYDETSLVASEYSGVLITDSNIRGYGYSFVVPINNEGAFCSFQNYLYVPENTSGGQTIFLLWYKKIGGSWVNTHQSPDFIVPTTGAIGEWVFLFSAMEYQSGDTGLVMVASYGDPISLTYGDESYDENIFLLNNSYEPYLAPEGHTPFLKMTYGYIGTCICNVGISEIENGSTFSLFPNPAQNEITLTGISTENSELIIYSIDGKEVLDQQMYGENKLDISSLQSGVYLVILVVDNTLYTAKFVKE